MESINSGVKFGNVQTTQGEPPKHTAPGHEHCAYYIDADTEGGLDTITMRCPHGQFAEGAFYSEDHVNAIRTHSHRLIGHLDSLLSNAPRIKPQGLLAQPGTDVYRIPEISTGQFYNINSLINKLRELTK